MNMGKYKPYPSYKDSGIEWLGDVPDHWDLKAIKYVASCNDEALNENTAGETEINYVEISGVSSDRGIHEVSRVAFKDAPSRARRIVQNEDVIVSTVRTYLKSIAQVKEAAENLIVSTGFAVIRPRAIESSFLGYLFHSEYLISEIISRSVGISYPAINATDLIRLKLPVPVLEEQTAIANFLDQETSKIDLLIEKQQAMIALLKEKIISLALNEQINGKGKMQRLRHLVHVVNRPVVIKDDEKYEALGLYNRGRGLFHKPKKPGLEMGDSDFYYVESGDLIISGQFAWEGAVTMATYNENGCVVSHRYPVIRGKSIDTEYLLSLLFTEYGDFLLNESSRGSAGRNRPLNLNLLLNEKIRIPSRQVQDELKRLIKLKTVTEVKAEQAIALLKERKTALISAAVTGKIDVREHINV